MIVPPLRTDQIEDAYVQIAAALPASEWTSIRDFIRNGEGAKLPSSIQAKSTPLSVERKAVTRYASLLTRLRTTNEAAYAPSHPLSESDLLKIRLLEELAISAAHVRFADGDRHEGVSLLLDGLTLSLRTSAQAARADAFQAFVRERQSIPLVECERVCAFVRRQGTEVSYDLQELRLRMRIEIYRWKYFTAPARTVEAAPAVETIDPRTGAAIPYERTESGYRLGKEIKRDSSTG